MRVLLDECLPKQLRHDLPGHYVATVADMRWRGIKNGALLRLAEAEFDVIVTVDRNMQHQQNLSGLNLGMVIMVAQSNRLATLRPLMPQVLVALASISPGDLVRIRG